MSSAFDKRVRKDNWGNFSILRHRAFDGVLVTSKNSGTHWVKYMFSVALADTYDVPRPLYFSEDAVRPYIGWPKDKPTYKELPRLAFSHTIPHRLADWGWARKLVRNGVAEGEARQFRKGWLVLRPADIGAHRIL